MEKPAPLSETQNGLVGLCEIPQGLTSFGSVIARKLGPRQGVPPYVCLPKMLALPRPHNLPAPILYPSGTLALYVLSTGGTSKTMSVEPGIVDANILIYALDAEAPQHVACRTLLEPARYAELAPDVFRSKTTKYRMLIMKTITGESHADAKSPSSGSFFGRKSFKPMISP